MRPASIPMFESRLGCKRRLLPKNQGFSLKLLLETA
jgi:hypothetical protein